MGSNLPKKPDEIINGGCYAEAKGYEKLNYRLEWMRWIKMR